MNMWPGLCLIIKGGFTFLFVCTPLKFVGATGSPVWPLAVVSDNA